MACRDEGMLSGDELMSEIAGVEEELTLSAGLGAPWPRGLQLPAGTAWASAASMERPFCRKRCAGRSLATPEVPVCPLSARDSSPDGRIPMIFPFSSSGMFEADPDLAAVGQPAPCRSLAAEAAEATLPAKVHQWRVMAACPSPAVPVITVTAVPGEPIRPAAPLRKGAAPPRCHLRELWAAEKDKGSRVPVSPQPGAGRLVRDPGAVKVALRTAIQVPARQKSRGVAAHRRLRELLAAEAGRTAQAPPTSDVAAFCNHLTQLQAAGAEGEAAAAVEVPEL